MCSWTFVREGFLRLASSCIYTHDISLVVTTSQPSCCNSRGHPSTSFVVGQAWKVSESSLFAIKCSVKQYDDFSNLDAVFETYWNRFLSGGSTCSKRIHAAMAKKPGYWQGTDNPLRDFLGSQVGSDSETSLEVSWVAENPTDLGEGQSLRIPQQFFPHGILVFFR